MITSEDRWKGISLLLTLVHLSTFVGTVALNGLLSVDVPLRTYTLIDWFTG